MNRFKTLKIEAVTDGWEECDAPGPFVRLTMGGEQFEMEPERAMAVGQVLINMGSKASSQVADVMFIPFAPREVAR